MVNKIYHNQFSRNNIVVGGISSFLTKNKEYFVEGYQAITVKNPDVTVMNMPLEELQLITPKFEELPNQ